MVHRGGLTLVSYKRKGVRKITGFLVHQKYIKLSLTTMWVVKPIFVYSVLI